MWTYLTVAVATVIAPLLMPLVHSIYMWPIVISQYFGICIYKIRGNKEVAFALKKLPKRSTMISSGKNAGWIWGWPYVGQVHVYDRNCDTVIYLITTKAMYKSLQSGKSANIEAEAEAPPETKISVWAKGGNYARFYYSKRSFNAQRYQVRNNQRTAVDSIVKTYQEKKKAVAFIYGKPGSGKSIVSLLICIELKASLCCTFKPTDPGDSLDLLYDYVVPDADKPLVIVIEEADVMFTDIFEGKVKIHRETPTQACNKAGINSLLDWVDRGIYEHIILIFTSNKDPSYIDAMDPSFLRPGRVDIKERIEYLDDTPETEHLDELKMD